jgi:soluble lytic murein transglycosylase
LAYTVTAKITSQTASPSAPLTLAPEVTPTPSPTPSGTPTPPPTSAPTHAPSPTPTPSLTPQADDRLAHALHDQAAGNYDHAIAGYLGILADATDPEQVRRARFHLSEGYLLNGNYAAAAGAWEEFINAYPGDELLAQASLMAARAFHANDECERAIPFYQAHLAEDTVLADMVYEWIGDCHATNGRLEDALAAYRRALEPARDRDLQARLREKIADAYLARGDHDGAVAEYDAILDAARGDADRARLEYLAGAALAAVGETEAAYTRYLGAVDRYPKAEHAYLSLVELVDAGIKVDDFQRGMVEYYAGALYPDAYGAAIRAFDRYLASGPAEKGDEALLRKALAQRALEQPATALDSLAALLERYPESEALAEVWLEKGATHAWMGDNDTAVRAYQDLASSFPADELAPVGLWRAAQLREREGAYKAAAQIYEDLQMRFPAFQDADEALWRAGLAHYRAGDMETAVAGWQNLLAKYPESAYRPRSLYWLGKLGAQPRSEGVSAYWDTLLAASPHSYYALRVEQIRSGESLTSSRFITSAIEMPTWDPSEAETETLDWLSSWTEVPTGTTLSTLPVTLTQRLDLRRGEALLASGLRREALAEFDKARAAAWKDPFSLAQLALYFHERDLPGLAARSALRMAGLWPDGTLHEAPLQVQRLAYPLRYTDLMSSEAKDRALDPLLMAALIRQESLFEPVAESYAGARGLGQVMPATGTGIAKSLGMDDFDLADLYRPSISIRFGVFYLGVQMARFDDQFLVALAAYNGGPGNTLRWLEAGGEDLDVFVEVITSAQSRLYLQRVYEGYKIYERLYRPSGVAMQQMMPETPTPEPH